MPKSEIPSVAIRVSPKDLSVNKLASLLRTGKPAVVGTVAEQALSLDLRTVFPHQDKALGEAMAHVLAG